MPPQLSNGLVPGGRFHAWEPATIAYVALDMDGTLLGRGAVVSDRTRRSVLAVAERGVAVGFASGRMRNGVRHIHRDIPVPGPHVFHDGAEVRAGRRTIASWPLTSDDVQTIVELAYALDAYCELYTEDRYYITRYRAGAELHWRTLDQKPEAELRPEHLDQIFLKATFIGYDSAETAAIESGARQSGLDVGSARAADIDGDFINVKASGVDKGRALAAAATHLGVELAAVMAIGDGPNDLPMLRVAGTAVAMGQSSDAVKRSAHLITSSIDEEGVARAIEALMGPPARDPLIS